MKLRCKIALFVLALLACSAAASLVVGASANDSGDDSSLSAAICPLVYRLDESPSGRGYRYSFFGNAFFINEQGALLTAAHVLETFRNGGQPSILLARPNRPPQLLPVTVVAADPEHDVAILHASPNPFASHYRVGFLSIASEPAVPGQPVLVLSLHPARLQNAQSFQAPIEDRSPGSVVSFETTQLEKSAPPAEVFLLSHPVALGQSGSPVLDLDSRAVVGLVEGRCSATVWFRLPSPITHPPSLPEPPSPSAMPLPFSIKRVSPGMPAAALLAGRPLLQIPKQLVEGLLFNR